MYYEHVQGAEESLAPPSAAHLFGQSWRKVKRRQEVASEVGADVVESGGGARPLPRLRFTLHKK
jgi:hypothetical protein